MVFADPDLDYAESVQVFVQTSQPVLRRQKAAVIAEDSSQRAEIRRIRQAEAKLCVERCAVRKLRKQEDMVWQATWQQQRLYEKTLDQVFAQTKLRAHWGSRKLQDEYHQDLREQHRQQIALRLQEDEQWRLARESLREQMKWLPLITIWIAVLVVTDNCTRQCLGLPLFVAGSHVTAEMVEEFRSNDCLFQLKIMGIVLRRGIPVIIIYPIPSLGLSPCGWKTQELQVHLLPCPAIVEQIIHFMKDYRMALYIVVLVFITTLWLGYESGWSSGMPRAAKARPSAIRAPATLISSPYGPASPPRPFSVGSRNSSFRAAGPAPVSFFGIAIMLIGMALRFWSVFTLGASFSNDG